MHKHTDTSQYINDFCEVKARLLRSARQIAVLHEPKEWPKTRNDEKDNWIWALYMLRLILWSSHWGHARGTDKLLDSILDLPSARITALACGDKKINGRILYTIVHCDLRATLRCVKRNTFNRSYSSRVSERHWRDCTLSRLNWTSQWQNPQMRFHFQWLTSWRLICVREWKNRANPQAMPVKL